MTLDGNADLFDDGLDRVLNQIDGVGAPLMWSGTQ